MAFCRRRFVCVQEDLALAPSPTQRCGHLKLLFNVLRSCHTQQQTAAPANKQAPIKAKLEKATVELEEAMVAAEEARREFEGDFVLQLMSFRQKGVVRQAAFVGAVLVANQAVFQAILVADDRGGNPVIALGGLVVSAALVWYYGYRPIKL